MARARNIKPGFFDNEVLAELPFEYRLLFIGLWTLADREGRLEDRPKRIKMVLFAADNVDCEVGLAALAGRGFIERYAVAGEKYIQILAWAKHQNPHPHEKPSEIPEKVDQSQPMVVASQPMAVAARLIPDSLIPDTPIPDKSISPKNGCGLKHTVPVDNSKNQLAQKSNSKPPAALKKGWWLSHAGIEAAANALHVMPKPGETHTELKQRCFVKIHPKGGEHVP